MTTVLRAYGHTPQWEKGGKNQLSAASRAAYRDIDLHFHDLRRESASRLHESGATLVEVQAYLGHTSVAQTATYLGSTPKALEAAVERMDQRQRAAAEEWQQRQAAQQEEEPPSKASAPPVAGPVLSLGSDRIQ